MSDEDPCTLEEVEAMASYLQGNAPALETAKIIMSVDEKHGPLEASSAREVASDLWKGRRGLSTER